MKITTSYRIGLRLIAVALVWGGIQQPVFADTMVSGWRLSGFYETDNRYRYSNKRLGSSENLGLSKQRNTLLLNGEKAFREGFGPFKNVGVSFNLRGSYDAVYDLNSDTYGEDAGRSICLEDTSGFIDRGCVPHGQGAFDGENLEYGPFAAFPGRFGFDIEQNPNEGMIILGEPLHRTNGGVAFGVPVRPCNVDSRGCLDDYMDADLNDLRFREFAEPERLDWLREFVVEGTLDVPSVFGGRDDRIKFEVGKQQVIWGRTDLFRVLDLVNPVDFSRNNIYDDLIDIRHPMWIATAEYQAGATSIFQDLNLQLLWNFDKFRPSTLGQCGTANVALTAGCFFRGMKNLWDNGGTVSNFALNPPVVGEPPPSITTDFGPHQIGIREAKVPDWSLADTEVGFKFEGILGPTSFSINGLLTRSDLPALHGGLSGPPSINPFLPSGEAERTPHLVAFDIHFPRVKMLGGSLDFTIPKFNTIHRFEVAATWGEQFANTLDEDLYSESRVIRYVMGIDRLTFIPFLNPNRTFIISFQTFGRHILDHESERRQYGEVGMPDFKHNWISTLLIQGYYMGDRLVPQFVTAYDYGAGAGAVRLRADYLITQQLKLRAGVNIKFGYNPFDFNDARDANPYPPFTAYEQAGQSLSEPGNPPGISGTEPLGRFRSFVLGEADKEDEIFVGLTYQFL